MLCLCSASITRADILRHSGVVFEQKDVSFDEEQIRAENARSFVYLAARGKMEAARAAFGLSRPLLCADTVIVAADGTILRKAQNIEDARRILLAQSGSEITILTSMHYAVSDLYLTDTSATHYRFAPFDLTALEKYLADGTWRGKAGACMVEGFCKPYIRETKGSENTARGLQIEVLLPWLKGDE